MKVYLFSADKRLNSTIIPAYSTAVVMDCNLKSATDILAPGIEIINASVGYNPTNFNYAYICDTQPGNGLNRWYFVKTWQWVDRKWIAQLVVDVLATYRTELQDMTPYVLRAYSTGLDPDQGVMDNAYPTKADVNFSWGTARNPMIGSLLNTSKQIANNGTYIVGIITKGGGAGGVSYYAFGATSFYLFTTQLFNAATYNFSSISQAASELSENFLKTLINPMQYVVSCMWFPFSGTYLQQRQLGTETMDVTIGWWEFSLSAPAYKLSDTKPNLTVNDFVSTTLPKHPQAALRGKYLNLNPYTTYSIYFYPFGFFDVDPLPLLDITTIYIVYSVDLRSGKAMMRLSDSTTYDADGQLTTGKVFKVVEAQAGVPMPIASIVSNPPDLSTALQAAAAAGISMTGNISDFFIRSGATLTKGVMGALGFDENKIERFTPESFTESDLSSIVSTALSSKTTAEMIGNAGTISGFTTQDFVIMCRTIPLVDDDPEDKGYPVCKQLSLGDCSGYVLCDSFEPHIGRATATEIEQLRNFLTSGFFAEWGYLP